MKYNERELTRVSGEKAEFEGRLNYKKVNINQYYQSVFRERWFKLVHNVLFYFRINDVGKISEKQIAGAFVLENASIKMENIQECPFAFSISFIDEPDKKYIFSAMTEDSVLLWIKTLQCASYEYLRSQLYLLQSKIFSKTGKDPLLMVPRNAGSMNWAPGEPLPTHSINMKKKMPNGSGFVSHLSSSNTVHRSKSSVSVLNKSVIKDSSFLENSWPGYSGGLERSKTTVQVFPPKTDAFDDIEFVTHPQFDKLYHRTAPSPPPRKKNSPLLTRNNLKANSNNKSSDLVIDNDFLLVHSSSSYPPLPPQRKNSPKRGIQNAEKDNTENKEENVASSLSDVNLIEF